MSGELHAWLGGFTKIDRAFPGLTRRRAAPRHILAVIVAGVAGTIANSVVVAALTPNAFMPLAVSPDRNAVAIAVAALLPVIYAGTSGVVAAVIAVAALTVIPSILAKLVFGIGAPWHFVLGVNAVYALAAWAVYCAIARTGVTRPARRSPMTGSDRRPAQKTIAAQRHVPLAEAELASRSVGMLGPSARQISHSSMVSRYLVSNSALSTSSLVAPSSMT